MSVEARTDEQPIEMYFSGDEQLHRRLEEGAKIPAEKEDISRFGPKLLAIYRKLLKR